MAHVAERPLITSGESRDEASHSVVLSGADGEDHGSHVRPHEPAIYAVLSVDLRGAPEQAGFGILFAIAMPLLYACIGAVGTLIAAALYNLVAGWVGGIEVEFE